VYKINILSDGLLPRVFLLVNPRKNVKKKRNLSNKKPIDYDIEIFYVSLYK